MDTDREANAIRIGGTDYLLTVTSGDAVHLTRETGAGETGQTAVPEQYLAPGHEQLAMPLCGYGQAALARPRWEAVTLCGREWITMAGISLWDDSVEAYAAAPSCRRCLALKDKLFPAPELDDRFDLAVQGHCRHRRRARVRRDVGRPRRPASPPSQAGPVSSQEMHRAARPAHADVLVAVLGYVRGRVTAL